MTEDAFGLNHSAAKVSIPSENEYLSCLINLTLSALAEYGPRVLRKVSALQERIAQANGQTVLVNDLMRWFSFDLMGAFAFSEDFGMMEKSEYHAAIQMLRSAITLLGPFSPAIWIPRLGFAFIPGLWKVKHWFGMLAFCDSCMERRMKVRPLACCDLEATITHARTRLILDRSQGTGYCVVVY